MYLYAYTIRQVHPGGVIETICGSWSRDEPISTQDEYTKTVKDIGKSCGFECGVIESFSLISSPQTTEQGEKTLDQHRAEFVKRAKSVELPLGRVSSGGLYISNETHFAWQAWKAAKGI